MATKLKDVETVGQALDRMDVERASPLMSVDLVNALAEIEGATKDKVNPHFKSKYADIGSVIDAIKPVLAKHNLAFYQRPQPSEGGVLVQTMLRHTSGEEVDLGTLYVPANKNDAQGFGSALTYARRYALMTAFGVPAEDDDGNAAAASSRANPTTGETPPAKRVVLDGPYTCPTQLKTAAKAFVRTLESMGDLDEFIAWSETQDYKEFCTQLARDMPDWWQGGPSVPAEFVPLEMRIRQRREDLERTEGVRA
jgi:hypothetical protein